MAKEKCLKKLAERRHIIPSEHRWKLKTYKAIKSYLNYFQVKPLPETLYFLALSYIIIGLMPLPMTDSEDPFTCSPWLTVKTYLRAAHDWQLRPIYMQPMIDSEDPLTCSPWLTVKTHLRAAHDWQWRPIYVQPMIDSEDPFTCSPFLTVKTHLLAAHDWQWSPIYVEPIYAQIHLLSKFYTLMTGSDNWKWRACPSSLYAVYSADSSQQLLNHRLSKLRSRLC